MKFQDIMEKAIDILCTENKKEKQQNKFFQQGTHTVLQGSRL